MAWTRDRAAAGRGPGRREDRRLLWGVAGAAVCLALGVRLWVALVSGFQVDDAWITYRYAENLAAGEGFAYNPGERVYGTTTPLFTLLLAAGRLAGAPAPALSLALSLAATAVTVLLLAGIGGPRLGTAWTALLVGLFAVAPSQVVWSVSGMETAVFVAFAVGAVAAYASGRWTLLGLAAAGAFLTRFDALVLVVALVTTEVILRVLGRAVPGGLRAGGSGETATSFPGQDGGPWRGPLRAAGVFALAAAPWLAFAAVHFGDVVPNAVWAKTGLHRGISLETLPGVLREALDPGLVPFGAAVALAVAGTWGLARRRSPLLVAPVWIAGYSLFLALGRVHLHPWYTVPLHPLLLVVWVAGLCSVAGWAGAALRRLRAGDSDPSPAGRLSHRLAVAGCAVVVAGAGSVPAALVEAQMRQAQHERAHAAVGRFLAERSRPGELVYAWDIGYVGWLSGRRVLDWHGIVSPELIPYQRRSEHVRALLDFRPAWAVVGLYHPASEQIFGAPEVRDLYDQVDLRTGGILATGRPGEPFEGRGQYVV
ncbi:MAG: hypothetical protein ACOC7L_00195, partial [Acidobacteriota bacterium]